MPVPVFGEARRSLDDGGDGGGLAGAQGIHRDGGGGAGEDEVVGGDSVVVENPTSSAGCSRIAKNQIRQRAVTIELHCRVSRDVERVEVGSGAAAVSDRAARPVSRIAPQPAAGRLGPCAVGGMHGGSAGADQQRQEQRRAGGAGTIRNWPGWGGGTNDVTKYDGPLISGEIGTIDGFRIIETVLR